MERNVFPLFAVGPFAVLIDHNETADLQNMVRNAAVDGLYSPILATLLAEYFRPLLPVVVLLRIGMRFENYALFEFVVENDVMDLGDGA